MSELAERNAIVTGAAQGLGEALALRLAREGADLLLGDLNEEGVSQTAQRIAAETGRRVEAMRLDVTREPDVVNFFAKGVERFGRIDIAVSNAAILIAEPILEAEAEKWRAVVNVNLFGNFLVTREACRVMKPQGRGSIIQINSKSGKKGSARNSAYASSKFGGIGLVQSVALEMAEYGVRCNAVCPGNLLEGPLWTDPEKGLFVQYLKAGKVPGARTVEEVRQFYVNQVPLRRGCTYDDVGNVVVFLASEKSSYMTGQAINVTGGQAM